MWSSTVLMIDKRTEHCSQMPLTKDQHTVGEFGSDRQHKSLGEAACPRTTRRNLHDGDVRIGQDRIERRGELASSITNEESELAGTVTQIHQQVAGLQGGSWSIWIRCHCRRCERNGCSSQVRKAR